MKQRFCRMETFCWAVILVILVFIHCFQIGSVPCGINVDEMGMGYDAWCLSHYGTDRYLNSFPVYLINFSGGQSALYAYLCAPLVYMFGISATTLRIPAIFFSFITLFFTVQIANFIWNNKKVSLLVGILYTVFPVFLMLSRVGLDCNLMLGMSAMFLYFVLKAVNSGKNINFFIAGLAGGLLLYSYVLSHMVMPLFIILLLAYLIYVGKVNFKNVVMMGVPLFLLGLPLMLVHYINIFDLNEFKLGIFTIPKLYRYRSDDLALNAVSDNFIYFFKTTFMYDDIPFNSIPKYGNMYFFSIPFLVIGIGHGLFECFQAFRKRKMSTYMVVTLWAVCIYATGIFITDGGPTVYRVNSIFFTYLLFIVDGILILSRAVAECVRLRMQIFYGSVLTIYAGLFTSFIIFYFHDYVAKTQTVDLFNFPFDDVLDFIQQELPDSAAGRTVYIGDCDQTYIYYLGSTLTPPDAYNELVDNKPYTLWLWTQSYKNYRFYFPEEIDPSGNYIVPDRNTELIDLCSQYGFRREYVGRHYLFWNDMLDETQSSADALVDWGHGIKDGNVVADEGKYTSLSGWALNTSYNTTWDDVVAVIDEKNYYAAEKMERKDVADVLQNVAFTQCGFHITIPNDVLEDCESVRILFIDYSHRKCYIEKY